MNLVTDTKNELSVWKDRMANGSGSLRVARSSTRHPLKDAQKVHSYPEVFLQIDGENHFNIPGGDMVLRAGEALLMPAGTPHGESAKNGRRPFRMLVIGLTSWELCFIYGIRRMSPAPVVESVFCTPNPNAKAQQALLLSLERYFAHPSGYRASAGLMHVLLEECIRHLDLPATFDWKLSEQTLSQKAKQLVQTRLRDPACNVAVLAGELGVTPNYLSSRFHAETGMRLSSYLLQERLEHARDLLRDTGMRVVEIAPASGFAEASPFIAHFKAKTGLTPKQYRETLKYVESFSPAAVGAGKGIGWA